VANNLPARHERGLCLAVPAPLQQGSRPAVDSRVMQPRTIVILVLAGVIGVFLVVGLAGLFLAA